MLIPKASHYTLPGGTAIAAIATGPASARKPAPASLRPGSFRLTAEVAAIE